LSCGTRIRSLRGIGEESAMDTEIKRADSGDAATVALLGRLTFAETFGYLFQDHRCDLRAYLDATFDPAKIADSLCKPKNLYWLAFARGLPVGYAKLKHPSPRPGQHGAEAAQLQKIYVLREFLGARIGRDLLASSLAAAAARSSLVWLDVLQENDRAVRFYERHGFRAIGEDTYTIGAQSFLFTLMARPTR
jgi:ribosomal protein S18 acetylase RimI-like enzyme